MVKGITRQVILVKSPDPRLFEEAIFIVKEEALAREGVSADRVLKEARQAADGYLKQGRAWNRPASPLLCALWGAGGVLLASLGWAGWIFLL
ncbi:MAG: translation initiation factor 2 [Lawsonibacter sp.]|nr:translation initiation factor 2 [Lawsonibacter sp.]